MAKKVKEDGRDIRYVDDDIVPFEVVPEFTGSKELQEAYTEFAYDIIGEPMCMSCSYSNHDSTCDAYPNGIPLEILSGEVNHFLPYEGDSGIQYKAVEEEE